MTKLALTLCAAAAIAAPALATTPMSFTWEGHKIVGTVEQVGGVQVIKGRDLTTHSDFEFHVKNGYVRGSYDGVSIAYPAPKAKLATTTAG